MSIFEKLTTPGEYQFSISGQVGQVEAVLTVPEDWDKRHIALLGHPHSLQGGTMNNKVVTTLVRAFKEQHIASIRINFRGVGQSAGVYDEGIGESEDMLLLARLCKQEIPGVKILFAGFSFGSYVVYRAAAQCRHALLVTIAPPVHHYDYTEFSQVPGPWIVAQGNDDEVVPVELVLDFIAQSSADISLLRFADTGHFFHGKLIELKLLLTEAIRAEVKDL